MAPWLISNFCSSYNDRFGKRSNFAERLSFCWEECCKEEKNPGDENQWSENTVEVGHMVSTAQQYDCLMALESIRNKTRSPNNSTEKNTHLLRLQLKSGPNSAALRSLVHHTVKWHYDANRLNRGQTVSDASLSRHHAAMADRRWRLFIEVQKISVLREEVEALQWQRLASEKRLWGMCNLSWKVNS